MQQPIMRRGVRAGRGRRFGMCSAILALGLPIAVLTGCSEDVQQRFNAAAVSSIEDGLKSIANGLITGLATIATPDNQDSGSGTSGSGTSGSNSNTQTGGSAQTGA